MVLGQTNEWVFADGVFLNRTQESNLLCSLHNFQNYRNTILPKQLGNKETLATRIYFSAQIR